MPPEEFDDQTLGYGVSATEPCAHAQARQFSGVSRATIEGVFGLSFEKVLVILMIAAFVIGPQRIPMYAQKFRDLVRSVKRMADGAKGRFKEEMGPDFEDVDWKQLDPRQYDPRRIIRDALLEDDREAAATRRAATAAPAKRDSGTFHFDDEAT